MGDGRWSGDSNARAMSHVHPCPMPMGKNGQDGTGLRGQREGERDREREIEREEKGEIGVNRIDRSIDLDLPCFRLTPSRHSARRQDAHGADFP